MDNTDTLILTELVLLYSEILNIEELLATHSNNADEKFINDLYERRLVHTKLMQNLFDRIEKEKGWKSDEQSV